MFTEPAPGKVRIYLRLRHTAPIGAQVLEAEGKIRFASPLASPGPGRVTPARPAPTAPAASPVPTPAASPAPTPDPSPGSGPIVPDVSDPTPPKPPTEPDEALPEGAGPLLFPRPDSAE
jgi:hypothetical protein